MNNILFGFSIFVKSLSHNNLMVQKETFKNKRSKKGGDAYVVVIFYCRYLVFENNDSGYRPDEAFMLI
jgi:hypothetical protein